MDLNLRWIGEADYDRLALTRLRCYGASMSELPKFRAWIDEDARGKPADYLLAERDGETVGTATSLSMTMWVRGTPLSCQGVAWVGTIRTARRVSSRESSNESAGVATQLMRETIRKAREREQVVSALMPFRASFYEHFGYGIVERRHQWFVPLSILPSGSSHGIRYFDSTTDLTSLQKCRQQQVEAGQCDIETSEQSWPNYLRDFENGFAYVDGDSVSANGWMLAVEEKVDGQRCLRISEQGYCSPDALHRQLHFLSGLKDQFVGVILTLPTDLMLNHVLKETQLPHRPVAHATARASLQTRMQVRILDHVKFFEGQNFPSHLRSQAVVAINESEGTISKLRLTLDEGRVSAMRSDATADFECSDATWASIICGESHATMALQAGIATCSDDRVIELLDALSRSGTAPFCREYF